MERKPPKYLFPEGLPNINQYIFVISITSAVVNQERCIASVELIIETIRTTLYISTIR